MPSSEPQPACFSGASRFATTHWSLVARAQDPASPEASAALAALCKTYWYPLYAFIRRQGHSFNSAQDLTQEFFARLLEKDFLAQVDRECGRFRSFLLAACKHFLANERDRHQAQKRGGGKRPVSLDFGDAETRFAREPAHELTPEKLFERRWALTLLDQVLSRLRQEMQDGPGGDLFDTLKRFLMAGQDKVPYSQVAGELGMTAGAVKVAVHRLRQRYRELLRSEIAQTVDRPEQIDDEIRDLFAALAS